MRFAPRSESEEDILARLSLSGAMWNWIVVSEMSCDMSLVKRFEGCDGLGEAYCYGVFIEENHGGGWRERVAVSISRVPRNGICGVEVFGRV